MKNMKKENIITISVFVLIIFFFAVTFWVLPILFTSVFALFGMKADGFFHSSIGTTYFSAF